MTLRFVRRIAKTDHSTTEKSGHGRTAIDVHQPLPLGNARVLRSCDKMLTRCCPDDTMLQPDLLSFHMIRSEHDNTIISYHCSEKYGSISADDLCTRLQLVGRSVYWSIIFRDYGDDATFVLVSMLWYALYSWDEAIEGLYVKIRELVSQLHASSLHWLTSYVGSSSNENCRSG